MKSFIESSGRKLALTVVTLTSLTLVGGCCNKKSSQASYYSAPVAYESPKPAPAPTPTGRAEGEMVVPLYQESVKVGKREVDAGSVKVKKIVKTETINQPVELRHEEVVIEREAAGAQTADQSQAAAAQAFQEKETVITLKREEPVIQKETTSAGQVVVKKSATAEQTNVQAQVRREDIDIVKLDNAGQDIQASGAAESAGGKTTGAGGTITDPSMINSSAVGKSVQLSGFKVQKVVTGDHVVVLNSDSGQSLYALFGELTPNIKAGDTVNLTGTVKQSAGSPALSSLSEETAQALRGQPVYIDAQKIEVTGK